MTCGRQEGEIRARTKRQRRVLNEALDKGTFCYDDSAYAVETEQ